MPTPHGGHRRYELQLCGVEPRMSGLAECAVLFQQLKDLFAVDVVLFAELA